MRTDPYFFFMVCPAPWGLFPESAEVWSKEGEGGREATPVWAMGCQRDLENMATKEIGT